MRTDRFCPCQEKHESTQFVVITGGPGAGKTAVLELARKQLCEHVAVLPEAASIIFGGGFWRMDSVSARMASQRAIYHVQQELENLVKGEKKWGLGLCDRGTLDSLAYWPAAESLFWETMETSETLEYERYKAIIHLRTPSAEFGYNHQNPIRIESAVEAAEIDKRIEKIWSGHSHYQQIASSFNFIDKVAKALDLIMAQVPPCCRNYLK
jgi:predicted ATPase